MAYILILPKNYFDVLVFFENIFEDHFIVFLLWIIGIPVASISWNISEWKYKCQTWFSGLLSKYSSVS